MHVKSFHVTNFRRLKDVQVDLDPDTSIFVGANNSGKTSATQVFQLFLGKFKGDFSIYDFTSDCWELFNRFDPATQDSEVELPQITFDLWFEVDDLNVHRIVDLLPSLDWDGTPVGIRMAFRPKDRGSLLRNYSEAREKADSVSGVKDSSYTPWPCNLTDYLKKRLRSEYEIYYWMLDAEQFDGDHCQNPDYEPSLLGNAASGAAKVVESLIRVDFLDAQRYLSDGESRGRYEDLSKRLSRFYIRNLRKHEDDLEALAALADSEARLTAHFAEVFKPVLGSLGELGYPGVGNHELVVKADFNAATILSGNAHVHYALPTADNTKTAEVPTLPDRYNGLGFKNLIYMAVESLDFHHAWADTDGERPPVHLIMIEEPESHLHAQLQQVFIRKIVDVPPKPIDGFQTQIVVTTHSAHVIYESKFKNIRYFRRIPAGAALQASDVRNLSTFYDVEEAATRDFLLQYLKLTHCDLFFADAALLVEGNVERLLLPLMIQKECPSLQASHLTILEVGGAFAHKFDKLIAFLDLPTLVITDLDSVEAKADHAGDGGEPEFARDGPHSEDVAAGMKSCMTDLPGAVTSNETLKRWMPRLSTVADLLQADDHQKLAVDAVGEPRKARVAYQISRPASWGGSTTAATGRSLEEAFALENLEWCQDPARRYLGLNIRGTNQKLG